MSSGPYSSLACSSSMNKQESGGISIHDVPSTSNNDKARSQQQSPKEYNEQCNEENSNCAITVELTMDQVVEEIGFGRFHWHLMFLCGVGYFAEITELVVVSFVAPSIQRQMGLTNVQYGLLGSSSFVGMALGALFWGYVGDHYGRQISFTLTVWLTFFGGALSAVSPNYAILLFLRLTAAFGIGGMLPVDYTVFLEFLPRHKRGSNIVLVDAIGVLPALTLSATIAWYFSGSDQVEWRWVLAISSIPVGIMAVLRRHVPESPRYHLARGDISKAQDVVQRVADQNKIDLPHGWQLLAQTHENALIDTTETNSAKRQDGAYVAMANSQDDEEAMKQTAPKDASQAYQGGGDETTPEHACADAVSISAAAAAAVGDDDDGKGDGQAVVVVSKPTSDGGGHSFAQLLQGKTMRATTWRLWLLYFLVQFSSAGMVFALPKLFAEGFPNKTERDIALALLIGVLGLIPGLAIAYVAVEKSRKRSLAGFFLAAGTSVLLLGAAFLELESQVWAIVFSIVLRGAMEGCFAILNTTAVESYPTVLRASGLGTAQIFDHIAGSISPIFFSLLNGNQRTQTWAFYFYAGAYILGMLPALTLPVDYAGQAVSDY